MDPFEIMDECSKILPRSKRSFGNGNRNKLNMILGRCIDSPYFNQFVTSPNADRLDLKQHYKTSSTSDEEKKFHCTIDDYDLASTLKLGSGYHKKLRTKSSHTRRKIVENRLLSCIFTF